MSSAAPTDLQGTGLMAGLISFQAKANANARVASLLKGWSPVFHLVCTDTGGAYSLRVDACKVQSVSAGHEPAGHVIRLEAQEADLAALFTGGLNPVEAHFNGSLQVYGETKDHVKLDAITMVLWNA